MKKICIIGALEFKTMSTGGQPVKTRELYHALCEKYGEKHIEYVDTYGWKKKPLGMFMEINKKATENDVLIMLPAHNGVKIFSRLLFYYKKKKRKKIFYDVIGGWLPEKLKDNPFLRKYLKEFDGIWVETSSMKKSMENLGLNNIVVIPNFKSLEIVDIKNECKQYKEPFKFCTFSRVTEKKGIEDAVNAINYVNNTLKRIACRLDIYGQIDDDYKEKFEELIHQNSNCVEYKGIVEPDKSTETLKNYFALLFPTRFYTEGIPGTFIDAYCAGVPVITALWANSEDVFKEGITGWGYKFGDIEKFNELVYKAVMDNIEFLTMKHGCTKEAEKYISSKVMEDISQYIG